MTEPVTPEAPDTRHGLTPRSPCRLSRPGIVCPLGADHGLISSALFSASRGLRVSDDFSPGTPLSLGRVTARLVDDSD